MICEEFYKYEKFWLQAYKVNDEKAFNLHLRKKYIIEELTEICEEVDKSKILRRTIVNS